VPGEVLTLVMDVFDEVRVMVPPLPVTGVAVPAARAPIVPLTEIGTDELPPEVSVTVTTAAVPLAIALALLPDARQMTEPVPLLHRTVLPAAVRADPAVTLTEATSAGV